MYFIAVAQMSDLDTSRSTLPQTGDSSVKEPYPTGVVCDAVCDSKVR